MYMYKYKYIYIYTYIRGSKPFQLARQVAAPEFLQIGLGTALNLAGTVVVELAAQHDSDLFSGKHVGLLGWS
jgi:hypothetical protein